MYIHYVYATDKMNDIWLYPNISLISYEFFYFVLKLDINIHRVRKKYLIYPIHKIYYISLIQYYYNLDDL